MSVTAKPDIKIEPTEVPPANADLPLREMSLDKAEVLIRKTEALHSGLFSRLSK